jgi:hypothetical protein
MWIAIHAVCVILRNYLVTPQSLRCHGQPRETGPPELMSCNAERIFNRMNVAGEAMSVCLSSSPQWPGQVGCTTAEEPRHDS